MTFTAGAKLGPYEILSAIRAVEQGEVQSTRYASESHGRIWKRDDETERIRSTVKRLGE